MAKKLTHHRLTQLLSYNRRTGLFRWKVSTSNRVKVGDVAGSIKDRYARISVDGERWYAHRLAWFYVTGKRPRLIVDHGDNTELNNRWGNLRLATVRQNNANCGPRARNKSGFKGVSYSKSNKGYVAYVAHRYLGTYETPEEAHAVYVVEAKKVYGEFARAA